MFPWLWFLIVVAGGFLVFRLLKVSRSHQRRIEELMGIKLAMVSLIDLKDPYTEGHSRNVRDLAGRFAAYLRLSPEQGEEIATAAELHDIGKIGVPDVILRKMGNLDRTEFYEIKKHPVSGANALRSIKGLENVARMIRGHHEKFDGSGYPDGLAKAQIPFGARLINIVDTFDAMVNGRSYRKAIDRKETLRMMKGEKGTHFDPELLDSFIQFLEETGRAPALDPVCGMTVGRAPASRQCIHAGKIYLFCSETCLQEFKRFPEKYDRRPGFRLSKEKSLASSGRRDSIS